MNRARDRNYDFAGGDETITVELLRHEPRVCESTLDVFVFLQRQYILSRADDSDDERPFQRRLAQRLDQHTIRSAVEPFEVIRNLRPVGNRAIVTGCETQHRFRRRYCGWTRSRSLRKRSCSRGEAEKEGPRGRE